VAAFPLSEFTPQALIRCSSAAFGSSSGLKQLGSIVDKLTYLGSCELLLDPGTISLKSALNAWPPAITGILLERQLDNLTSISRKEGVRAVGLQLLADATCVYAENDMPVRKARVLVRSLDLAYHSGSEGDVEVEYPGDVGQEADKLLTRTVSFPAHSAVEQIY
jgi:separase